MEKKRHRIPRYNFISVDFFTENYGENLSSITFLHNEDVDKLEKIIDNKMSYDVREVFVNETKMLDKQTFRILISPCLFSLSEFE